MMKTCLYITLLSTLCASLALAYPADNYLFNRSGISDATGLGITFLCIKGGGVVPINALGSASAEMDIPEAARENVVKAQRLDAGGAALRRDGRLAVWGNPFSDQEHGGDNATYAPSASHTRTVSNVVDIAAFERPIPQSATPLFMLMEDGTVRVFGAAGDLPTIPLHPDITDPVALVGDYTYVAVLDASGIARMIYRDETLLSSPSEERLHALSDIASFGGPCAIHTDGAVSSFAGGTFYAGQQAFFDGLTGQTIVHVDTEDSSVLAVTADGRLHAHNLSIDVNAIPPDLASNAKMAIFRSSSGCFGLDREGRAYLWGSNADANGVSGRTELPSYLNSPIITVAFGNAHGIVVRADGTVRGWGDDTHGQASGLNGVTNAIAVAADADYSLALLADGTVVGAGNDTHGQIAGLSAFTDVIDIAAGEEHSLVTFRDGTVSGAGNDADGRISGLSDLQGVLDIAAGFDHSVARYGDRKIFCAGNNELGQCTLPARILNANYILDIAAGYRTSAAVIYSKKDVDEGGIISYANFADDDEHGIAGSLHFWGAKGGNRYTGTEIAGYNYFRSIELSDSSTIATLGASYTVRYSTHLAPGTPDNAAVNSSTETHAYRGGFTGGTGSYVSEPALAEAECHMFAAGGHFHAAIAGDGRLRIFPDVALSSLSGVQRALLYPPSLIYELASDDEVTLNSLLQASQPGPGIEIQTQVGDTYEIETTTNLTDTNSWTTLPAESNTRFYRLRKK